jgi:hypothetical protein
MTPVSSPQNEAQLARRAGVQAWYNVLRVGEISASELEPGESHIKNLHAEVSICGLSEGCLLCRRRGEQDWSDARLQDANQWPFSCKRILSITRLQPGLHLTAIKNPYRFFLAAPTSNILIYSPTSCAIPPAPKTPARHHHWPSCSNTLPIRVTGDRPTNNLSAHGGKPTSIWPDALEGSLTMWTNGLSSANQQVGVPAGDLEYDLSTPLDYPDRRAVDGKDGR